MQGKYLMWAVGARGAMLGGWRGTGKQGGLWSPPLSRLAPLPSLLSGVCGFFEAGGEAGSGQTEPAVCVGLVGLETYRGWKHFDLRMRKRPSVDLTGRLTTQNSENGNNKSDEEPPQPMQPPPILAYTHLGIWL